MNKPLTISIKETESTLIDVCNNSGLPVSILELIVKNLLTEIHELSMKQLQEDTIKYNNFLKEQEQSNKNKLEEVAV